MVRASTAGPHDTVPVGPLLGAFLTVCAIKSLRGPVGYGEPERTEVPEAMRDTTG